MNNTLGTTPQPNPWADDWVDFLRDHRIGHQLTLARQKIALMDADPGIDFEDLLGISQALCKDILS